MASEKDFELLDQYVSNRLNAQDKAAFEQKLEADAELKNEFLLQQRVVAGIRKARATELKKLLNDIPVSSIPSEGTSIIAQIGMWVVMAGLVGTGLYFYFNQEDKAETQQTITNEVKAEKPQLDDSKKEEQPQQENQAPVQTDVTAEQKDKVTAPETVTPEKTQEKPIERSPLDVFDPSEDVDNAAQDNTERDKATISSTPSIIVQTETNKKYNFHYQFKDNKLYLYGSFEKNLYEIMEFFSDNKRTMFLFYKDNYYLLNEESDKVKALEPISDATLLKKLKDYRKN
jgi:hypothetical protein